MGCSQCCAVYPKWEVGLLTGGGGQGTRKNLGAPPPKLVGGGGGSMDKTMNLLL